MREITDSELSPSSSCERGFLGYSEYVAGRFTSSIYEYRNLLVFVEEYRVQERTMDGSY